MSTVVISDIHIGDNSRTCWYQQSHHKNHLLALLDWIILNVTAKNPPIDRLVILGDFFDFWTYPPDQPPPTVDKILAANPNLFGADGKMRKVMDALNGNVLYVHGNHDINITQADLDLIPTGPNKIKLVDDIYYDSDRIVYTHGHLFTMFNAPDPRFPGEVPVGHFVTRAIAYHVNNILHAGQTAADLRYQGSPYGPDLPSIIPGLSGQFGNPSITGALLDYVAAWAGLPEDQDIVMADGTVTSIAEVKAKYDGLWTNWATRYGGGQFGDTAAAKAAQADYEGTYMAWFAQKVAMEYGALGTVMGHTHKPKSGIQNSWIRYVNSGFECPSKPDIIASTDPAHFNFATVDSRSNLQLWQVDSNGSVSQENDPRKASPDHVVFAPFMDYSCYVRIANNTNNELVKQAQDAQYGNYVVPPPDRIPANTTVEIWLQDLPGIHGAEGSVTYSQADGSGSMKFTYGCPSLSSNYAAGGAEFVAASGDPPSSNAPRNYVPGWGHPLFVEFFGARDLHMTDISLRQFILGRGAEPSEGIRHFAPAAPFAPYFSVRDFIRSSSGHPLPWTPTSLLAKAVYAAGFLYDPGQDIIYSRMDPLQRQFGFAYGYDAAAIGMDAILDCEPIFFDYAGKHWAIWLWKGQYGLETGCEIGVYNRPIGSTSTWYDFLDATIGRRPGDANPSHNRFFDCANNNERLVMSSTLYKNGRLLICRGPETHWWLTGFKWGVYSRPQELTMDISITCLDAAMCAVLVNALQGMGYRVHVSSNTVRFRFATPSSHQPISDLPAAAVQAVEGYDQSIVNEYNGFGFPNNDPNTIPDSALAKIMDAVGIYSWDFFAQAVANLAWNAGLDANSVINGLVQAFKIGIDEATDLATQAGYVFSNWVGSVENALGVNLNFSCFVEISNRSGPYDLILEHDQINQGYYAVPPPNRISAGRMARFWLKDLKPSIHGAEGWAQYYYIDSANNKHSITFTYECPTGANPNVAATSEPFHFYTKSGDINLGWSVINQITQWGHPLYVAFVYGNAPAPA